RSQAGPPPLADRSTQASCPAYVEHRVENVGNILGRDAKRQPKPPLGTAAVAAHPHAIAAPARRFKMPMTRRRELVGVFDQHDHATHTVASERQGRESRRSACAFRLQSIILAAPYRARRSSPPSPPTPEKPRRRVGSHARGWWEEAAKTSKRFLKRSRRRRVRAGGVKG